MTDYLAELRVAQAIAREAGRRMQRERRAGFGVDLKARNDLVTDIDRSIEEFVKEQLCASFPDDAILGEEFGTREVDSDSDRQWLVDPIDGTMNFVQGIPIYCVSIALQEGGRTRVGVIYDPNRDEMFSAREGSPTMLDGEPARVSDCPRLEDAVLATGFPPLKKPDEQEDNLENFVRMSKASRGVRRLGSAAIDLAYVAVGRLDGFWEYHLNPWDTAAGYFLVQCAGGRVTDASGGDYTGFEESVLATNGRIHDSMTDVLRAK